MIRQMKRIPKRVSAVLLSLGLMALQAAPVMAAEEYTYTVRLFSGAQGTVSGKEMVLQEGLHYGQQVAFNQRDVALKDNSKYYIKGFRESGKDNNTAVELPSFPVTGDMDYVVVYGIFTDKTSYTINYVDGDGNELAPSETYYGNVGDTPVVAYLYIDGYQPQAYNMTGVLDKDASKNVFNFVYTPIGGAQQPAPAGPTTAPGTQPTTAPAAQPTTAPATQPTTAPAAQPTTAPAGDAAAGTADEGGDAGAAADDGTADAGAAAAEEGNGPAELENIGDEEVPLANMDNGESPLTGLSGDFAKRIGELPLAAKIGVCSAVLLGLGVAGWFLLGRRREPTGIEDFHE